MFERLSVPARKAIVVAHELARVDGRKTIDAADLVAGFLQVEEAVAGGLLRASGLPVVEPASDTGTGADDPDDLLRLTMVAAVGVATARGSRSIGTTSLLLALIALAPPRLATILDAAGIAVDELAGAARAVDDSGESAAASGESIAASGDAVWVVTVGGSDPTVAWDDRQD